MKKLLPLMLLSTLIACGGKSGGKGQDPILTQEEMFSAAETLMSNTTRGMVSLITSDGYVVSQYKDPETGKFKKDNQPSKSRSKEIVLKTIGNQTYSLVEETDLTKMETRKYVELTDSDTSNLKGEVRGSISNGIYRLKTTVTETKTEGTTTTTMTLSLSGQINLLNPCQHNITMDMSGVMLIQNYDGDVKFNGKTNMVSTCGKSLSENELKKIDLSSIEFCDNTQEEEKCEANKNMTELTADL